MGQIVSIITAIFTILGFGGIFGIIKNWDRIRTSVAEYTRRGVKVIYVLVSYNKEGTCILNLYLCGEEKSWLFSGSSAKNRDSYILAIKEVHYGPSYDTYSNREDWAEWEAQLTRPLSEEPLPALVQLVDKSQFRFRFNSDNDEPIIVSDSFKLKTELTECLKKYRIKYIKKATEATGRWKIKNRYPT